MCVDPSPLAQDDRGVILGCALLSLSCHYDNLHAIPAKVGIQRNPHVIPAKAGIQPYLFVDLSTG